MPSRQNEKLSRPPPPRLDALTSTGSGGSSGCYSNGSSCASSALLAATAANDAGRREVAHDLMLALGNDNGLEEYADVYLESSSNDDGGTSSSSGGGSNGVQIPAIRFVLAARSPVWKRMLYGNFSEATRSVISMPQYSTPILQAIVDYCHFNTIPDAPVLAANNDSNDENDNDEQEVDEDAVVRQAMSLRKAADYFCLEGLGLAMDRMTRALMTENPALACIVLDEALPDSDLAEDAMQIIECRPYVALDHGDGDIKKSNTNEGHCHYSDNSINDNNNNDAGLVQKQQPAQQSNPLDLGLTPSSSSTLAANASTEEHYRRGGGVECLRADRLIDVMKNPNLGAGELFLFRMLRRWYRYHVAKAAAAAEDDDNSTSCSNNSNDKAATPLVVAQQCCRYMFFHHIEPRELLTTVQSCPFVPQDRIFAAIAKQALQASKSRIWSLRCRGRESAARVLVEGAGARDANGMYYRIAGLANGELYSKREVACGQQFVYTLSCITVTHDNASHSNDQNSKGEEYTECRIFCNKLLTNNAVERIRGMQISGVVDPTFQPVMQVLRVQLPPENCASVPTPIRKFYRVRLSDGKVHMPGTLAKPLNELVRAADMAENTLVKILEFGVYQLDGHTTAIHVSRVSIVNANPGQVFGNPTRALDAEEQAAAAAAVEARDTTTTTTASAAAAAEGSSVLAPSPLLPSVADNNKNQDGMQNLYWCRYPTNTLTAGDARIPRTGWQVEDAAGLAPGPFCTWIPPLQKSPTTTPTTATFSTPGTLSPTACTSVPTDVSSTRRASSGSMSPRQLLFDLEQQPLHSSSSGVSLLTAAAASASANSNNAVVDMQQQQQLNNSTRSSASSRTCLV